MAHHEIIINLVDGNDPKGPHAIPDLPPPGIINVNDTVHYSSPHGAVRVVFANPFGGPHLKEIVDETITFLEPGVFGCRCFITPPGKPECGWKPGSEKSGGFHDVQPH